MSTNKKIIFVAVIAILVASILLVFFANNDSSFLAKKRVEHKEKWGIYTLNLENNQTELIYS